MYISHKSNVIQTIQDTEWECRRTSKGLTNSEYWTWIATITTQDENGFDVITYPSEDFTIVECIDEDVWKRLAQLDDYISSTPEGTTYNIKWSDSKVNDSHFVPDDTAKDARVLAEKWTAVRRDRDRKLAETDFHALSDGTLSSNMKDYRSALRDVPSDNPNPDSINWPVKP